MLRPGSAAARLRLSLAPAARRCAMAGSRRRRALSAASGAPAFKSHEAYLAEQRGKEGAVNDPKSVYDGYSREAVRVAHKKVYNADPNSVFVDEPLEPGALSASIPVDSRLPCSTATTSTVVPEYREAMDAGLAELGLADKDAEAFVIENYKWPEDDRTWEEVTAAEKAGFRPRFFGEDWQASSLPDVDLNKAFRTESEGMTQVLDALKGLLTSPPAHFTDRDNEQTRQLYESILRNDVEVPEEFPATFEWMRDLNYVRELRPHVSKLTAATRYKDEHNVMEDVSLPEGIPESRRAVAMPILTRIASHPKYSADQKVEMIAALRLALSRLDGDSERAALFEEVEVLPDADEDGDAAGRK